MPKLRAEIEGPDGGVFITRDGEVVQESISSLTITISNDGRMLTVGHPMADVLGGKTYEVLVRYMIGKATIIIDTEEASPWQ